MKSTKFLFVILISCIFLSCGKKQTAEKIFRFNEPNGIESLDPINEAAHALGEDFRAAAGERAKTGLLQLAQHLFVGQPRERRHVVDLGGRVALEAHVRKSVVQLRDRAQVEVEVDVRVLPVHDVDLGETRQLVLAHRIRHQLVRRLRVGLLLLLRRREGAELALHAADVRLVQVQVLDEVDAVVPAADTPGEVGEVADREQVVRLHQRESVLEVEPLARLHLGADLVEAGFECDRHQRPLACPIDDGVGQGRELVSVRVRDQKRASAGGVVESGVA